MIFTVEWLSNNTNTWPINQAVSTHLENINTTYVDRVEGYNLPAGTYSYTGNAHHDQNYYNNIMLYDPAGNVIVDITDAIGNWQDGGPYSGSFTLASPTTVYAKTGDQYYMYATRLTLYLTTADQAPSAPTSLSWVDLYNGTISVSFTPGFNGGSDIINYVYSLDGGANYNSSSQTTSPITITGLSNRTNYSLVLKALNGIGPGTPSSPLSLYYMCFLEGTKILCFNSESQQEEYRPIESLRKGDLVKTFSNGYKPVDTIGTSKIYNPANNMRSLNRLYRCSKENYPSLTDDLVITGCHSILVKDITEEERATLLDLQGKIYVTEKNYRLIAAADKKATPYEQEGFFNIWHLALEHPEYTFNYGVYANGLLVESSSMRMMREMSGMDLIQ